MIDIINSVVGACLSNRGGGKTTAICKAAREIDAVVVVGCLSEAKRLNTEHKVKTIAVEQLENLRGRHEATLWDDTAVLRVCQLMENLVERREREARKALAKKISMLLISELGGSDA